MDILIVEDARDQRFLIATVLRKKGYTVFEAENGRQALNVLNENSDIRMIVSDWLMPEMDGIQLCQAIRESSFDYYLYFILLTSKTENDSLVEGITAGADDFVSKPVNFDELGARLKAGSRIIELKRILEEKNQALSVAIETIEKDLHAAALTLTGMLAKPAIINNVTFNWFFQPCKPLGGDMFGYQALGHDYLFFYQLDVAGHGMPSALFSFTLNHILSEPIDAECMKENPSWVLERLNNRFQTTSEQILYFTMAYGVINHKTGDVVLAQAGHPNPLWLQKKSGTIEGIEGRGVPIGMLSGAEYDSASFRLEPGDRLFLYSDGLTECSNEQGEFFGEKRLCKILQNSFLYNVQETISSVETHIKNWHQNNAFEDDITYLILEWNP